MAIKAKYLQILNGEKIADTILTFKDEHEFTDYIGKAVTNWYNMHGRHEVSPWMILSEDGYEFKTAHIGNLETLEVIFD